MSFEASIAKNGNYHDVDLTDSRNWPRPRKQQNSQQETEEVIKDEKNPEVTEDGVAAIADDEDGE